MGHTSVSKLRRFFCWHWWQEQTMTRLVKCQLIQNVDWNIGCNSLNNLCALEFSSLNVHLTFKIERIRYSEQFFEESLRRSRFNSKKTEPKWGGEASCSRFPFNRSGGDTAAGAARREKRGKKTGMAMTLGDEICQKTRPLTHWLLEHSFPFWSKDFFWGEL